MMGNYGRNILKRREFCVLWLLLLEFCKILAINIESPNKNCHIKRKRNFWIPKMPNFVSFQNWQNLSVFLSVFETDKNWQKNWQILSAILSVLDELFSLISFLSVFWLTIRHSTFLLLILLFWAFRGFF